MVMEPCPNDLELDAFYRVIAPFYDEDYAGLIGGVEFYRQLAVECGGPVLEMGCGTGRMLLPLARAGITVCGMDASLAMLEQLCATLRAETAEVRERMTIIQGDIRSTDAGQRFPLVIAAGNVLHSFIDRADQRAWLANARRHLAPGGAFCFDVFQFDYTRLLIPPDQWNVQVDRVDESSGKRTQRLYRVEHEPEFQRFRVYFRWLTEDADGAILSEDSASVMQRWFTRGELELLFEIEGFAITDYWGGFEREPFGKGSTEQIIRAVARA